MEKRVRQILNKPYTRRLVPDETGGYVSSILEFPGCIADGDTADEALNNLESAAAAWIESALETGYEFREPADFNGCSGKLALRLPRGLHQQIAELSELEDCSVNQLVVSAVSEYLGSRKAFRAATDRVCGEMRRIVRDGLVALYRDGPSSVTVMLGRSYEHGSYVETRIDAPFKQETFAFPHNIRQIDLKECANV